jgi:two-component system, sensor histidine kinase RegB
MDLHSAYQKEQLELKSEWVKKIRTIAVIAYTALVAFAYYKLGIKTDYPLILGILFLLFFNAFSHTVLASIYNGNLRVLIAQSLLFDIVLVSLLLYFTGGHTNPFSTMLLLYVFLMAVSLDEGWTWAAFFTSAVSFASLFWWYHTVPAFGGHEHHHHHGGFSIHLYGMLLSFILLGGLFSYFFSRLHRERSRMEEELFILRNRDLEDQRLISLANFCAGAGHELGTPLATIQLIVDDIMSKKADILPIQDDLEDLQDELERVTEILRKMRAGVEVEGEIPERCSIQEIIKELEIKAGEYGDFTLQGEDAFSSTIFTFKGALISSLLVLIKNAYHSYSQNDSNHKEIIIDITDNGESIYWKIKDEGAGMSDETLRHLGEPFFTTKEVGYGMGLGVYLAKSFCRLVGGSLEFRSSVGYGTEAILKMPKSVS